MFHYVGITCCKEVETGKVKWISGYKASFGWIWATPTVQGNEVSISRWRVILFHWRSQNVKQSVGKTAFLVPLWFLCEARELMYKSIINPERSHSVPLIWSLHRYCQIKPRVTRICDHCLIPLLCLLVLHLPHLPHLWKCVTHS